MERIVIAVLFSAGLGLIVFHQFRIRTEAPERARKNVALSRTAVQSSAGDCRMQSVRLLWPLGGEAGKDWVIANYVDHDKRKNSMRDYLGRTGAEAVTYDGHQGLDLEIPNFRMMDKGIPVYAATEGVVEEVFDSSPDRNLHCAPDKWNHVTLRHTGGWKTIYAHLKRGSVKVHPGAKVAAGTLLGFVGSSGCSTFPHLHFEVVDCQGRVIDPVKDALFVSPPNDVMTWAPKVMDLSIFQPIIHSILPILDPGTTDRNLVSAGYDFSVGVTISALKPGDVLSMEFLSPAREDREVFFERLVTQFLPRSHWWGNYRFDFPGTWTLVIKVNERTIYERPVIASQ